MTASPESSTPLFGRLLATACAAGLLVAGCAPAPTPPLPGAFAGVASVEDLVAALAEADIDVKPMGAVAYAWFDVPGHTYALGSEGRDTLFVHEYPDPAAARGASRRISPDGTSVIAADGTNVRVEWLGEPHAYLSGRLLAVYVGESVDAARALEAALGPQFAGSPPP
jgi:hypothetical protein